MPQSLLVTQLGAVGDGKTLCTKAIQKAVDQVSAAGGGTVIVPPGLFICGTLQLQSGVTLDLQAGATLRGSGDMADYPQMPWDRRGDRHRHHFIVAHQVHDVTIKGGGTIDGNGPAFWKTHPDQAAPRTWIGAKSPRVSPMLELHGCRNLRLLDVNIVNSPGWTVHLSQCDHTWVRGVKLVNCMFGPNTDGFDINGCRDLMLSDCHIECGDDAIVLKTTGDSRSCERLTVTNCIIRTNCVALKCGTESWHDFRQITFSNCVVFKSTRAVGLYVLDGGTLEDVAISNIVCDTDSGFILNRPIHLDLRKRDVEGGSDLVPLEQQRIGRIRNVSIDNFIARTDGRILMTAADGGRLENIRLSGVRLSYPIIDDPAPTGAAARSAQFSNHSPQARVARAAVVADQVDGLEIDGLSIDWPDRAGPPSPDSDWARAVRGENGSNAQVQAEFGADSAGGGAVPMSVLWGRGLRGGLIDAPLAQAAHPTAARFDLADSDIRIRE